MNILWRYVQWLYFLPVHERNIALFVTILVCFFGAYGFLQMCTYWWETRTIYHKDRLELSALRVAVRRGREEHRTSNASEHTPG